MKVQKGKNDNSLIELATLKKVLPVSYQLLEVIAQTEKLNTSDIFSEISNNKPIDFEVVIAVGIFVLIYFDNKFKNDPTEAYAVAIKIVQTCNFEISELVKRVFVDDRISFDSLAQYLAKTEIRKSDDVLLVLRKFISDNRTEQH